MWLLILDKVSDFKRVVQLALRLSRQGEDQILNWYLESAPKGILDAVDGAVHENLKLDILRQRVLSLATSYVRVAWLLDIGLSMVISGAIFLGSPRECHLLFDLFSLLL